MRAFHGLAGISCIIFKKNSQILIDEMIALSSGGKIIYVHLLTFAIVLIDVSGFFRPESYPALRES